MPSRPCANLTWIVGLASFSQQPKGPDCRPLIIGVCQAGRQVYVIGEIFQRFLNNGVRNTKGLASWLISPQVEGSPRRFPRLKIRITAEDLYEISRAWWGGGGRVVREVYRPTRWLPSPVEGLRLREVASRKLPEIIALIERSELVRGWLECAARCECPDLDDCPLFEDPPLKPLDDSNRGHRQQLARGRTGHREHRIR